MISRQYAMQFETCGTILGGIFQEKILGESVSGPSTSLTWIWGNLGFSNNGDLPFHKSIHLSKREKKLSGIISLNRKTKNLSHALIWMKTKLMKPLPNKWHISLHAVLSFLFCSTYFSPCGCFKFWLCASLQWYPYFCLIFRGWLPPRKHRYNIGRYIGQYIQYWTITKWTNGQNLGQYITKITKIGNIEDLRGHNVNVGHNNDIYGNITLSIIVGNFVRSIKGNWHFRWKFHLLKKRPCKYGIWNRVFKRV